MLANSGRRWLASERATWSWFYTSIHFTSPLRFHSSRHRHNVASTSTDRPPFHPLSLFLRFCVSPFVLLVNSRSPQTQTLRPSVSSLNFTPSVCLFGPPIQSRVNSHCPYPSLPSLCLIFSFFLFRSRSLVSPSYFDSIHIPGPLLSVQSSPVR